VTYLVDHASRVEALALAHMTLVAAALVVALLIAFPLAIVALRRPRLSPLILGTLGAVYTIPSLALLALLVQAFGLGTLPIFIALVAYGQFILVRNIQAGLTSVDPAQRDTALGIGMSPWQSLLRIEIPLAMPIIIGGVRIAAVAMIAMATLGAYVGGTGLGTLIFTGLTLHHNDEIVAGSIAASALAIISDGALRLAEGAVRRSL
jgi:osmoprotectant transport system permease protein